MQGKKDAWKNDSRGASFSEHHMQDEFCDPANDATRRGQGARTSPKENQG